VEIVGRSSGSGVGRMGRRAWSRRRWWPDGEAGRGEAASWPDGEAGAVVGAGRRGGCDNGRGEAGRWWAWRWPGAGRRGGSGNGRGEACRRRRVRPNGEAAAVSVVSESERGEGEAADGKVSLLCRVPAIRHSTKIFLKYKIILCRVSTIRHSAKSSLPSVSQRGLHMKSKSFNVDLLGFYT
jgi:hypothetical protein